MARRFAIHHSTLATSLALLLLVATIPSASADDFAPQPDEQQLPLAMHSKMTDRPTVSVGRADAQIMALTIGRFKPPWITWPDWAAAPSRLVPASISCTTRCTFVPTSR